MERHTHASMGAWTLGPTPPAQAWGDAFRSIELVGTKTTSLAQQQEDPMVDAPRVEDPIEAARSWLRDPERLAALPGPLVEQAEATLQVAELHLRELDLLAGEVAHEANELGMLDPIRLEQVDLMASVVRAYAVRMRDLLDPDALEVDSAQARLQRGLEASRQGGLAALVAAL